MQIAAPSEPQVPSGVNLGARFNFLDRFPAPHPRKESGFFLFRQQPFGYQSKLFGTRLAALSGWVHGSQMDGNASPDSLKFTANAPLAAFEISAARHGSPAGDAVRPCGYRAAAGGNADPSTCATDVISVGFQPAAQIFFNDTRTRVYNFGVTTTGGSAGLTFDRVDVNLGGGNAASNVEPVIIQVFNGLGGTGTVLATGAFPAGSLTSQFEFRQVSLANTITPGDPITLPTGGIP